MCVGMTTGSSLQAWNAGAETDGRHLGAVRQHATNDPESVPGLKRAFGCVPDRALVNLSAPSELVRACDE
jgi:hypothetical protein